MRLIIDNRTYNLNEDSVYENCTIEQVFNMLNMLDGKKHTLLNLERADKWQLSVGGGVNYFIVTASSIGKNLTLLNSQGTDCEMVELCAGGQFADFPTSIIVEKEMVVKAISNFFTSNEQNMIWDEGQVQISEPMGLTNGVCNQWGQT